MNFTTHFSPLVQFALALFTRFLCAVRGFETNYCFLALRLVLQSGLPGVVLSTDTAKWQVQVQLDSDPRSKWLPPGKLEMDLLRE